MQELSVSLVGFGLWSLAQKRTVPQWKEYAYPDAGFAVAAPVSPRIYPDPKAPDVRVYRWELTSHAEFVIHSTGPRPACLKAVTTFKESNGKNLPGAYVPGSIRDVSQIRLTGVEYEIRPKTALWAVERLYCTQEKMYLLTLFYPRNQARPKIADRMFNSFRLLAIK